LEAPLPIVGSSPNKSFQRTDGTRTGSEVWQEAKTAGVKIRADAHDTHDEDIGDAISACLFKDGSNLNADIPMNSNKFTGVEDASARTHFAAAGQVADSALTYAGTSAGTDTITATLSPAITAYVTGQRYHFKAGGTNTGAATINFNSVGAASIKKGPDGATALAAGDITTGGIYTVEYDGTNFQLLNPKFPAGFATTDSPQFSTIELGAASDTTLSRASAGVLAVEGVSLLRANQNLGDVADAATAFGNIKQAASDTATGVLEIAVQSEMEAGSSTTLAVTPGRQHFHPGSAKAWINLEQIGTISDRASYNVTSISDGGVGLTTINWGTDVGSADYAVAAWAKSGDATDGDGSFVTQAIANDKAAGSILIKVMDASGGVRDSADVGIVAFGDFA
jgi:hypothetical protein